MIISKDERKGPKTQVLELGISRQPGFTLTAAQKPPLEQAPGGGADTPMIAAFQT